MTNILIKNATVKEINQALLRLQGADSNSGTTTNVTVRSSSSSSGGSSVNLSGVYSKIQTNAKNIASNTSSISLINTKLTEDEKSIKANTTNITKNANNIASNSSKIGSIIGILSTDLYTLSAGDTTLALKNNYTLTEQEVTVPYATAALNDSDGNAINDTYLKLTGGILTGDLTVNGNIYQNGSSYITHAEHLYSKDDLILTRDGATTGLSSGTYTGIEALLYDGTNNGYLVFDNSGTQLVGDEGSLVPLQARDAEANMTDNKLVYWDATNKILKTSTFPSSGSYLPLTGGTLTGDLTVNGALYGTYYGMEKLQGSFNNGQSAITYIHIGSLYYSNYGYGNVGIDVLFGGDSLLDKCNVNIYGWAQGINKPGIKVTGARFASDYGILGVYYVLGSAWSSNIEIYVGLRQLYNSSYSYSIVSEFNRNSFSFEGSLLTSLPSGQVSVLPFGYGAGPWEATNVDATSHGIVPQTDNTYSLGVTNYRYNAVYATSFIGNASTATKATQDGNGSVISSTYLKLAGGTMTGQLTGTTATFTTVNAALNGNQSTASQPLGGYSITDCLLPYAGTEDISSSGSLTAFASGQKTFLGSQYLNPYWYNVISIRHRNGAGDGNAYGLLIYNYMTMERSLQYQQHIAGNWSSQKTILDSSNYTTYTSQYLPLTGGTLTGQLTGTTQQFDSVTTILHPTSFISGQTSLTAGTTYYVKLGSIVWHVGQCQTKFQFRMYGNCVVSSVDVILSDSDSYGNLNITCNTNQFVLGYGIQQIGLTSSSSWNTAKDVYAVVIAQATDSYNFTTNVETNNSMSFIAPSPSSTAVTLPYQTSTANRGISNNNYITQPTVNATTVNATTLSTTSARKYKKNIKEWKQNALDLIDKVNVVEYKYKSENDSNEKHIGFIADDTDKLLSGEKQDKMRIQDSIGVLIKAVQELKQLYTNIIDK